MSSFPSRSFCLQSLSPELLELILCECQAIPFFRLQCCSTLLRSVGQSATARRITKAKVLAVLQHRLMGLTATAAWAEPKRRQRICSTVRAHAAQELKRRFVRHHGNRHAIEHGLIAFSGLPAFNQPELMRGRLGRLMHMTDFAAALSEAPYEPTCVNGGWRMAMGGVRWAASSVWRASSRPIDLT